jgi:hypothetical protein
LENSIGKVFIERKKRKDYPQVYSWQNLMNPKHTDDAGRIYNHVDCERLQLFDPGNSVLAGKVTVLFWRVHMNKRMFY